MVSVTNRNALLTAFLISSGPSFNVSRACSQCEVAFALQPGWFMVPRLYYLAVGSADASHVPERRRHRAEAGEPQDLVAAGARACASGRFRSRARATARAPLSVTVTKAMATPATAPPATRPVAKRLPGPSSDSAAVSPRLRAARSASARTRPPTKIGRGRRERQVGADGERQRRRRRRARRSPRARADHHELPVEVERQEPLMSVAISVACGAG